MVASPSDPLNSLLVILIVGSLAVLSFLLVSNPLRVNKRGNLFFGLFLFFWASFWMEEVLALIGAEVSATWFPPVLHILQLMTPVLFYFSVLGFTHPYRRLVFRDLIHLIPPVAYFAALAAWPGETTRLGKWFVITILLQALYYTAAPYILLIRHGKRVEFFDSDRQAIDLRWIKRIIQALFGIGIFITIYNLLAWRSQLNLLANGIMLAVIYFVAYHAVAQREIFVVGQEQLERIIRDREPETEPKQELIPAAHLEGLKTQLGAMMRSEKPYLQGDLNLATLAGRMDLTPHHLSYLLNAGFGDNFFQYVNKFRVEEAKKLLLSEETSQLSILGIAYESGFNSKTAFNDVFKKQTGMTPTAFKKHNQSG